MWRKVEQKNEAFCLVETSVKDTNAVTVKYEFLCSSREESLFCPKFPHFLQADLLLSLLNLGDTTRLCCICRNVGSLKTQGCCLNAEVAGDAAASRPSAPTNFWPS